MKVRHLVLPFAALLAAAPVAAQTAPIHLDLNIPARQLLVYEGDQIVRTFPVAVGMPGHATPTGDYSIRVAEWNPSWHPPESEWAKDDKITPPGPNNPMGKVKLSFSTYYYIPGNPDDASIGRPASHGCVRMHNRDAVALARMLQGVAAPQVSPALMDRLLSSWRDTRRIAFQSAIPLHVHYDPVVVRDGEVHVYPDIYDFNALHSEAVYQALIAAGYDARLVDPADVDRLVKEAKGSKKGITVSVQKAFGSAVAASASAPRGTTVATPAA
ncbi:MAG TPA: L,D-transpeptidase family protein [Longimicrobiaceae bacterium]|nr:L,D-transpeptidase family protein [Longimicrobiaceae bacterium]